TSRARLVCLMPGPISSTFSFSWWFILTYFWPSKLLCLHETRFWCHNIATSLLPDPGIAKTRNLVCTSNTVQSSICDT
ncbi:hypothetical protein B0H10DRAFT_2035371, partial [Mycena sp. CBHHK59/15]